MCRSYAQESCLVTGPGTQVNFVYQVFSGSLLPLIIKFFERNVIVFFHNFALKITLIPLSLLLEYHNHLTVSWSIQAVTFFLFLSLFYNHPRSIKNKQEIALHSRAFSVNNVQTFKNILLIYVESTAIPYIRLGMGQGLSCLAMCIKSNNKDICARFVCDKIKWFYGSNYCSLLSCHYQNFMSM